MTSEMPAGSLFGTDGVRGIPGEYPLTPDIVRRLGLTAARVFWEHHRRESGFFSNGNAPIVLMGRDTRRSGPLVGRWLAQGLTSAGCWVKDIGVVPTPAVAYLTPRLHASFGAILSASHNPHEFNGIKFVTAHGAKASVALEQEIERRLTTCVDPGPHAPHRAMMRVPGAVSEYMDYLRSTLPAHCDLSGLRIVLDAANGAAYRIGPEILRALGATVFSIGCAPNGANINRGFGALDTRAMRREVARHGAHCGVSLDGDADRAIFCDERGRLADGDCLIAMSALSLQEQGLLRGNKVVLTVMSNLGLIQFLRERGVDAVQVPVGDRNVTEALEAGDLSLGGEASGHIVFRRFARTGDGLLTALQTLAVLVQGRHPMSHYLSLYPKYPQALNNVRSEIKVPLENLPRLRRRVREHERGLKGRGRIFVRYSGTEPILRILVEGPERALVMRISRDLAETFKKETSERRQQHQGAAYAH